MIPLPEHQSIFGDTYHGVPNPWVPHCHPYPTRYHGMARTYPVPGTEYIENPLAVPPYAGLGGGCGCGPIESLGSLGAAPLFEPITNTFGDAVIGAALGYVLAPASDKTLWAVGGAAAGGLAGMGGLVGLIAFAFYKKGG